MTRWVTVLSALAFAVPVTGNGQCRPARDSNEAKLLAFYVAPIAFSPSSAPEYQPSWTLRLGVEGGQVPDADPAIQQTGECLANNSVNTELSQFFARPRITLALPAHFAIEASYVAPIRINDTEPNLGSVALSKTQRISREEMGNSMNVMLRLHGTIGRVRGPIICPENGLQQSSAAEPCYGTRESNDTFKPRMFGVEGVIGTAAYDGRVGFYAGGGVNFLRPRFEAGFTDGAGLTDNTVVQVDLTRPVLIGGLSAQIFNSVDLSAQVYSVPKDVTTFRFGAGYHLSLKQ